uniref:Uncharacterized protein n=1 Tax=Knipowitschia caucasica TaxID=637954 RepID=A0AAV2LZV7_KNICA
MSPVSEPAVVGEGSESEYLPDETLPVTPNHLPEAEESVASVSNLPEHLPESEEEEESVELPVEGNLSDYALHPVSPEFVEIPLTEDDESVDPETLKPAEHPLQKLHKESKILIKEPSPIGVDRAWR